MPPAGKLGGDNVDDHDNKASDSIVAVNSESEKIGAMLLGILVGSAAISTGVLLGGKGKHT